MVVHSALPRYVLRKIRQRGSFGSGAEGMRPDETFRGGPSGRVGYSSTLTPRPLQSFLLLFCFPVNPLYQNFLIYTCPCRFLSLKPQGTG